ncbi:MAG: cation transporter, partial [Citromicrobium sp.]|nr:cation transporter [Citromicrobium sp.]
MAKNCCDAADVGDAHNDPQWRRILWVALALNAIMFAVEIVAGIAADSRALQADALDFLGDSANYAISLGVAGMAIAWRARAALAKAATMLAFGVWVLGSAIWGFFVGASPEPGTMGAIGSLALAVNLAVAAMLFRYRSGDANMRS